MWWNPKTELPVYVVARHHLKCSPAWVYELLARGELGGTNYGRRKTVVFKDSLAAYQTRQAQKQIDKLGLIFPGENPDTQPAEKKEQSSLF